MKSNDFNSRFARAFRQRQDARDIEAMFKLLVADNERRKQRGLPTFEPSYELAREIILNH